MSLPSTPLTSTTNCSICKKKFKSKWSLSQHEAVLCRYNSFHTGLYKLPRKFINEFKKTLVLLIYRQLPCHFTKIELKVVTVTCTESQFFSTFSGYIHHYSNKTKFYKCIFGGPVASNQLEKIFNNKIGKRNFIMEMK